MYTTDTIGSGGLLNEATRKKLTVNNCYALIVMVAIALTWLTNIYEIITIASKGFAVYYALQILLTLYTVWNKKDLNFRIIKMTFYISLFTLMMFVIVIGIPVE